MRTKLLPAVIASCLAGATACSEKTSAEREPAPAGKAPAGKTPTGGKTSGDDAPAPAAGTGTLQAGPNLLTHANVARHVPREATVVFAARSPQRVFEIFDRDAVVAELGSVYTSMVMEMKGVVGQDLFSLEGMQAFGLDPTRPGGLYFVSPRDESGGAFVGVSDRDKLVASITAIGTRLGDPVKSFNEGSATILCPPPGTEVCFVVKDDVAHLVINDSGDEAGLRMSKEVARMTVQTSVASNTIYQRSLARLEGGADAGLFVNLDRLIAAALERESAGDPEDLDTAIAELEARIAAAEKSGPDAPGIEEMRGELSSLKRAKEMEGEFAERAKKEDAFAQSLLDPIDSLALGVDFTAQTAKVHGFLEMGAGNVVSSFVRNGGQPHLVRVLGSEAMMTFAGRLNLPGIKDFIAQVAALEGESLDEVEKELEQELSLDLDEDIIAALSGDVGMSVLAQSRAFLSAAAADDTAKMMAAVDGAFTLGFTDAAKGEALLTKLLAMPPVSAFVRRDEAKKRWDIPTPVGKTLHLAVAGQPAMAVLASSEPLLERLTTGAPVAKPSTNPDMVEFLGATEVAGLMMGEQMLGGMGAYLMLSGFADYSEPMRSGEPTTAAYVKKKKELESVREELRDLERDSQKRTMEGMLELFEPWGTSGLSARLVDGGMELRGGQFIAAESWGALAVDVAGTGKAMFRAQETDRRTRDELWKKESRLYTELEEMRGDAPTAESGVKKGAVSPMPLEPSTPPAPPTPPTP